MTYIHRLSSNCRLELYNKLLVIILNPSFQDRWEVLELEIPVHFGFKDLLSSLVVSEGPWGAQNTPAWKSLRTLRLTATYEDSSLTPAKSAGSFLFGGKTIQAPNLKDLRLNLRTAVKPTPIVSLRQTFFHNPSASTLLLRLARFSLRLRHPP